MSIEASIAHIESEMVRMGYKVSSEAVDRKVSVDTVVFHSASVTNTPLNLAGDSVVNMELILAVYTPANRVKKANLDRRLSLQYDLIKEGLLVADFMESCEPLSAEYSSDKNNRAVFIVIGIQYYDQ